jgi:hypothetical protein
MERLSPVTGSTTVTPTGVRSVHSRVTDGTMKDAERLLATLGGADDRIWPKDRWLRLRLDEGLEVGSHGKQGPVRYRVLEVEPGRRVRFEFEPGCKPALTGWHELRVDPAGDDGLSWTHELMLEHPSAQVRSILLPLHDALIEDLLDQVEVEVGQHPLERPEFSAGIRARRAMFRPLRRSTTHREAQAPA